MTKLEELLKEFCPEGVEYKPLWELTAWDKKFNAVEKYKQKKIIDYHYYLATDIKKLAVDDGTVKILTTNSSDLFTDEDLVKNTMSEGEIIAIPWGGNPNVQYYKGKFVTADNRIATSLDTNVLDNKFLYYFMCSKINDIASLYRGSGIKHPDMNKLLGLQVPVPPLVVQREIVRILDNFTLYLAELTAKLTAELTARRKQYEFYRDSLLTFDKSVQQGGANNSVQWKKLGEVCKIRNGSDYKHLVDGNIPVYGSGGVMTYVSDYVYNKPSVLIPRKGSIDKLYYVGTPFWNVDTIFYTEIFDDVIVPKFLYYTLQKAHLEKLNTAGGVPSLTQTVLNNVSIPVPPLAEQERIVAILDKFDALCNDITAGLPAEIEMRKKQYEYYRDKLLTFKKRA